MSSLTPQRDSQETAASRMSLEDTAADWLARHELGLSANERVEFETWVAADAQHAAAVAQLKEAWNFLNHPRAAGRADAVKEAMILLRAKSARRRRRRVATLSVMFAAAAAILIAFRVGTSTTPNQSERSDVQTIALRPDRQILPDGSSVELNAGAEIETNYSAGVREVRLLRGQALFAVEKDPARPFVVSAGGVAVRAVGTVFAVHYDAAKVDVLVTEGKVAVEKTDGSGSLLRPLPAGRSDDVNQAPTAIEPFLTSGHRVAIPVMDAPPIDLPVAMLTQAEMTDVLAWRQRRVEFTSTSLAEAVPLFNQDGRIRLVLADPSTARLEISGVFWTDDAEAFARLLESSLGISARTDVDGRIVLRK